MTPYGIGTDLVDIARIRSAIERQGDAFLKRCFTKDEIDYCQRHADAAPSFAARWAAKEAIAKAFGTGIGEAMALNELEVVKLPSGQPAVSLHGGAKRHADSLGVREIKLSLSHTNALATATALVLVASPA